MGEGRQQALALAPRRRAALTYLDTHPNASNREIADAIGMSDEAQASRLLARMDYLGLVENRTCHDRGTPNAWRLTAEGRRLVAALETTPQLT